MTLFSILDSDAEDNKQFRSNDSNNNQKMHYSGSKKNARFFWQYNGESSD